MKSPPVYYPVTVQWKLKSVTEEISEQAKALQKLITFLNNQCITEDIKEEIKKFLEVNVNNYTIQWIFWDTTKSVQRRKFTESNSYISKTEQAQINNLIRNLKMLEKQQTSLTKLNGEIIKMRAEIKEIETKKPFEIV